MRVAAGYPIKQLDRLQEEVLAAFPVLEPLEPRATKNGSAGPKPFTDGLHSGARAKRKSTEVELCKAKMRNKLSNIPGQYAFGIILRLMRAVAKTMCAKVRHK